MNTINHYIQEKLRINKNLKSTNNMFSKEIKEKILTNLCYYFSKPGSYQGQKLDTRLTVVKKYFERDIYKFFDKLDLWDDLCDWLKNNDCEVDVNEFATYVDLNRDELFEEINDFVLDDDIIQ